LKNPFFYCPNDTKYGIGEFLIEDCVVRQSHGGARFLRANGANSCTFKDLTLKNSTVWNDQADNAGYFIQLQGAKTTDAGVDSWTNGAITLDHCTFYQCSEKDQFGNFNATFIQTGIDKMNILSSIFVDCGNKNVIRRFAKNATVGAANLTCAYNTYWYAGEFASDEDGTTGAGNAVDASGNVIKEDPMLANPDNGDFTVGGAGQKARKTGDPRWIK
jgi:hypothetical protein